MSQFSGLSPSVEKFCEASDWTSLGGLFLMSQFSGLSPSVEKFCEDSDGTGQGTLYLAWQVQKLVVSAVNFIYYWFLDIHMVFTNHYLAQN